jgi:hypothetical protein
MRPFYFIVSFWGAEFREHFLRLSAASILAPGNIPSLSNPEGSRFLICTTADDWAAIQRDPTFELLASRIQPVFIELRRPAPDFLRPILQEKRRRDGGSSSRPDAGDGEFSITPQDVLAGQAYAELERIGREIGHELTVHHHYALRIYFMSNGHKAGACRAFADNANAVFLGPDLVTSDGTVIELERLVREGHKVVLTATLRFAQDECLAAFKSDGLMEPGKPMVLSPRYMVATMFAHMHPETACFEFDSPYFCDTATSALWRVPGDDGVVLHNLNFYPLLVNYSGLTRHQEEYFDIGGTIDGKYIAMHFDPERDVTVVTDSDRLMLASFTRQSEYYYPVATGWRKTVPWFGTMYKTALIRRTLHGPMGDPVKRRFYTVPIRLHSKPLTPAWTHIEHRAAVVARRAVARPGLADLALGVHPMLTAWTWAGIRSRAWSLAAGLAARLPERQRQKLKNLAVRVAPNYRPR